MDFNLLSATPDDGAVVAVLAPARNTVKFTFPGTMNWVSRLGREGIGLRPVWLGPTDDATFRPPLNPDLPVLNQIGDADVCDVALQQAEHLLARVPDVPVFNHPTSVRRVRRDFALQTLASVPGVEAPRALRISASCRDEVIEAIAAAGLSWPVIVRAAGKHGGAGMVRLNSPANVAALDALALNDSLIQVAEFRETVDADGWYRKHRFLFIGGRIFLRHVISSRHWMIHAHSRHMDDDTIVYERRQLNDPDGEVFSRCGEALREIDRRFGLDFFGLDCHVAEDGTVTPFEANPCMDAFTNTHPEFDLWDRVLAEGWAAVLDLLREPARWRGAPQEAAS